MIWRVFLLINWDGKLSATCDRSKSVIFTYFFVMSNNFCHIFNCDLKWIFYTFLTAADSFTTLSITPNRNKLNKAFLFAIEKLSVFNTQRQMRLHVGCFLYVVYVQLVRSCLHFLSLGIWFAKRVTFIFRKNQKPNLISSKCFVW